MLSHSDSPFNSIQEKDIFDIIDKSEPL